MISVDDFVKSNFVCHSLKEVSDEMNEVKNLFSFVHIEVRDSSLTLRMIPMYREDFLRFHQVFIIQKSKTTSVLLHILKCPADRQYMHIVKSAVISALIGIIDR